MTQKKHSQEIILEYAQVGNALEVRAIDVADGLEVAFIVPANATDLEIQQLAASKLAYVRSRGARKSTKSARKAHQRGIVV